MLAVATFWKLFASAFFLLVCFLLIVVVLLQKGRGGGLSGAFGGAGGHSAFGAKTGDFFTWLTVGLAGLFLLLAIINNFAHRKITVSTPARPGQTPPGAVVPAGREGGPRDGSAPAGGPGGAQPAAPAPAGQTPPPARGGSQDAPKE